MPHDNITPRVRRQRTPFEIRRESKTNTPHFMTPTIASKLLHQSSSEKQVYSPASIKSIKSDSGQSLLQSAVKRVGLRGVPNEKTCEKKQSPVTYSKTISFPDKLSTRSLHSQQTTPDTNGKSNRAILLDKPLPEPPRMQLDLSEPTELSSTVTETVLEPTHNKLSERSSCKEDSVVKLPEPVSEGSLQTMMAATGNSLKQQAVSGVRRPRSGNLTEQRKKLDSYPDVQQQRQPVISRYSPTYKKLQGQAACDHDLEPQMKDGGQKFTEPFQCQAPTIDKQAVATADQCLSAAAAALEKSTSEAMMDQTPRQTRTSSLRARLSSGHLVKDSQNKILGFTDFTVSRTSSESLVHPRGRESWNVIKDTSSQESIDPRKLPLQQQQSLDYLQKKKSSHSLQSNQSTESLVKGHTPAQFIGGSRRPAPNTRPGSQNSNHNKSHEFKLASLGRPSSRQSQRSPALPDETQVSMRSVSSVDSRIKKRHSSLPVPTHGALDSISKPNKAASPGCRSTQADVTPTKTPRNEISTQRDRSSAELVSDLEAEVKNPFKNRASTQIFNDALEYRSLTAIEESPRQPFTLKRLSITSPEYGPRLRISPSADRLIMGKNDNKENESVQIKGSHRFFQKNTHAIHKQNSYGASATSLSKQPSDRPLSSHGKLQSSSRIPKFDSKTRARKVKSADLDSTLSVKQAATPEPSRQNTDASKGSKASSNDPSFVSAQEVSFKHLEDGMEAGPEPHGSQTIVDEAAWISGLKENRDECSHESNLTSASNFDVCAASDQLKSPSEIVSLEQQSASLPVMHSLDSNDSDVPSTVTLKPALAHQPSTPRPTDSRMSSYSSVHPPRSSSRVAHPDFTTSIFCSEQAAEAKGPSTPLRDVERQEIIQNNLGSRNGHASWQIDIADLESKRVSALLDSATRDSRESEKSPSITKKSFSGIRSLFNKRTSTTETPKSKNVKQIQPKSKAKAKPVKPKVKHTATTLTGSPHSPLTSIHPSHRATLASSARTSHSTLSPMTAASASTTPARSIQTPMTAPLTPLASPPPNAISTSTNLAMTLLNAARTEHSSPKKERLLQMSKIMVDAITQARDAARAAEEAKMASRRAEMARDICENMVEEVGRVIGEWGSEVVDGKDAAT